MFANVNINLHVYVFRMFVYDSKGLPVIFCTFVIHF